MREEISAETELYVNKAMETLTDKFLDTLEEYSVKCAEDNKSLQSQITSLKDEQIARTAKATLLRTLTTLAISAFGATLVLVAREVIRLLSK